MSNKIFLDSSILVEYRKGTMQTYNLLPNDALILSACQFHGIQYLASFDSDYTDACLSENIQLISNKVAFEAIV